MWILLLSVLFYIFCVVFLLSAILMSRNISKLKTLKARGLLRRRRNNTLVLTAVTLCIAVALTLWYSVPQYSFSGMKAGGGDIRGIYATALKREGAEKAYRHLPDRIARYGDGFTVHTGENAWFSYLAEGEEGKWSQSASVAQKIDDNHGYMRLWLHQNGNLYAEGSFYYMEFDSDARQYDGLLERDVVDFALSDNTLFYVTKEGILYGMGYNKYGQLGDSSNTSKTEPVQVMENISSISASDTHTLALDTFGNLYAFGDNSYAQLSNGTSISANTPEKIMTGIAQAEAGNYFTLILGQNGDLYSVGRDHLGQLGNAEAGDTAKAAVVLSNVYKIAAHHNTALALTYDGELYAWGENKSQCIATDGTTHFAAPTKIADNVYDAALGEGSIGILTRTRDVLVTGEMRLEKSKLTESVLTLSAEVPEDKMLPYTVVEKPDISEIEEK